VSSWAGAAPFAAPKRKTAGALGADGTMPSFFREPTPVRFKSRKIAPSVRCTWPQLPFRVGDDGRSRVRRIPRASPLVDAAKITARVCVKRRRAHSADSYCVIVTPRHGCEREGVRDVPRCPRRRLDSARDVAATRPPFPSPPLRSRRVKKRFSTGAILRNAGPAPPAQDLPIKPRRSNTRQG
jgi:hypothetical protein